MIAILPAVLAFAAGGVNLFLDRFRPKLAFRWSINFIAASLIVLVSAVVGLVNPLPVEFSLWQSDIIADLGLQIQFDPISWAFAMGLGFFLLFVVISREGNHALPSGGRSATAFFISGALFFMFSGMNLTALTAGLVALDLIQFAAEITILRQSNNSLNRSRRFGVRLTSIFLLLFSLYIPADNSMTVTGLAMSGWQSVMVLLAAGVRLGIFYPQLVGQSWTSQPEDVQPHDLLFSTSSGISGLVLISRFPVTDIPPIFFLVGLVFALLVSIILILGLLKEEHYQVCVSRLTAFAFVLAFVAALYSLRDAAVSWSISSVYAAILLTFGGRDQRLRRFILLTVVLLTIGLPFTPSWSGVNVYSVENLASLLFFMPHVLVTGLFFFSGWHSDIFAERQDGFQALLRRLVLILMLFAFAGFGVWAPLALNWRGNWWAAPSLLVFSTGLYAIRRRRPFAITQPGFDLLLDWLSLRWMRVAVRTFSRPFQRAFDLLSRVMEGDSGILWSMLLLVVLISILITLIQV